MQPIELAIARAKAEILLLKRWAAGDGVDAAKIFGLLNGFETVIHEERSEAISEHVQDVVEGLLSQIEAGEFDPSKDDFEHRLKTEGVSRGQAWTVMRYCHLNGDFPDAIALVAKHGPAEFQSIATATEHFTSNWHGALHYVELDDTTREPPKAMHAVFASAIPRVGELVRPESGPLMLVVGIEHRVSTFRDEGEVRRLMMPYVLLEPVAGEDGQEDSEAPGE